MDTKITFEFPFTDADGKGRNSQVRVVTIDGSPWFCGADALTVLYGGARGRAHSYDVLSPDEFLKVKRSHFGEITGGKMMWALSESGLYKLIMRSDKPQARAFQDWVTREVLLRIRKDGAYVMGEEKHGSVEDTVKAMYRASYFAFFGHPYVPLR